ncbi:hypothetical protein ABBQ32_013540 [Trebouxia sp. C0010 RCD-2024]
MLRCCDREHFDRMAAHCIKPFVFHKHSGVPEADAELVRFWEKLDLKSRQALLTVDKKALFQRIRNQYCSRCFGLFVMRYDELKCSAQLDCPTCQEFYAGLVCLESGSLTLEEHIVVGQPFATFTESKLRERERELQFMTGDICGSGWQKKPGLSMCHLHTSPVPIEALTEYWNNLPEEHKDTLFSMREEDFVAELDAHMKYQLKICKDCRCNVMRAYKDLKPCARDVKAGEQPSSLEICPGHSLSVVEGLVCVDGKATTEFFEQAEEVEDCNQAVEQDVEDDYHSPERIRHAETPELAREALVDSVVLIFKSQVEVAFREQTAGHNALLLFVHLALQMMEEQLLNAFKELRAKQAEAELLEALEEEHKQQESKKASKKKKKSGLKGSDKADSTDSVLSEANCTTPLSESALRPACSRCALLQGSTRPSPRQGRKGMACSRCLDCNVAAGTSVNQPASSLSSRASLDSLPQGPGSSHSQSVSMPSSMSSSSSSSGHSSSSDSLPCSGSKSPTEPSSPRSLSSQKTDDGWEVQQRGKRAVPSERQGSDISHGAASQPRACRTVIAPHPALSAAWQAAPGISPGLQKPLMKDVLLHHVHATPANIEVLHLASGPVSFQPPPPPPPPRTRAASADAGAARVQHGTVGNAWNVPGKTSSYTPGVHGNAWAPAVNKVNVVSDGHVPVVTSQAKAVTQVPESARFSLFSHFPVSNGGGSCSGMGSLQGMTHEQSSSTGYQLFGSSGVTFPSVSPLLPVSLY